MTQVVGTAQDLYQRLEDAKTPVLVRAINNCELEELVENSPQNYLFHSGTGYEYFLEIWELSKQDCKAVQLLFMFLRKKILIQLKMMDFLKQKPGQYVKKIFMDQ
jgi:hypothetical protein